MLIRRALFGLLLAGPAAARSFAERGVAVRGRAGHSVPWNGARWLLASAPNRARFLADPAAHAPAWGGFCAWAVAQGYTAPTDPSAWRIVEGRLFLNCDAAVQPRWERDIPGHIARGDANWPRLRQAG